MSLKQFEKLLKKHLEKGEKEETKKIIREMSSIKKKGYFTKKQFIKMATWKTPRPQKYYSLNKEPQIKKVSQKAFAAKTEKERIKLLDGLSGVGIPVASALLMFYDPNKYAVIDIRAWQTLFKYGLVKENKKGKNFTYKQWEKYLEIVRSYAKKYNVKPRDIDRALFYFYGDVK